MSEWARVVNSTISDFIKGEEVNVMRNRKLLAMMKEKGRVEMNHGGLSQTWRTRYKQQPLQGYGDGDTLTFPRRNKWQTASLDWRGYAMTDSMTKKERLMNRGAQQIIDVYSEITKLLMEDIKEQFGVELYVDGNATGNEKRIHGIESFCGNTGVSTAQPIAVNDDTFADLDTDLAAYGGTWSGNWPDGQGDSNYDFWTPLLVDYTSAVAAPAGWTAATKTWAMTCLEAMRYAILYTQKNRSKDDSLDMILLDTLLMRQFKDAAAVKERIIVERGGQDSELVKLGFKDVLTIDGVDVTNEYGIPALSGYGFNVDRMELDSMQPQLFVPEGPDPDIANKSDRFSIDFYGNAKWNPRNHCKLKNFS